MGDSNILIIDEEFNGHKIEKEMISSEFPEIRIIETDYKLTGIGSYLENTIGMLSQIYASIDIDLMSKSPHLKAISIYGGGYDRVDIRYATEKGIKVCRVPDYCNDEVAEYVIACILNFSKKLDYLNSRGKIGYWGAQAVSNVPIDDWNSEEMENLPQRVSGSTLFIVGYGKIGKALALKAHGLGMRILFFDPKVESSDRIAEKTDLETGLKEADFVSLNTTLNPTSRNLIDYPKISMMKKTAFLINTSRGAIINQDDLIMALEHQLIRGAALDVFSNEPLEANSNLYDIKRLFITPHSIYISEQSMRELKIRAATNLIYLLKGKSTESCVNCKISGNSTNSDSATSI